MTRIMRELRGVGECISKWSIDDTLYHAGCGKEKWEEDRLQVLGDQDHTTFYILDCKNILQQ